MNLPVAGRHNPVISGWYADPEIHFFQGRYYLYPTYSAPYEKQTFYEAFVSDDLVEWRSCGVVLDFADVPWSTNRAAWAPSVAEKNGKYYMYFSAGDGAGLGVAVSESPSGPFRDALGHPLVKEYVHGAQPIDAHGFVDDDGEAYLYWGGWRKAVVSRLGQDMISLEGEILEITPENYVEGPFMVKRDGRYYYMWSEGEWGNASYCVAYGIGDNPLGPFPRQGLVLQSDPEIATSAGHHSVLRLPNSDSYVIAYHRRPLEETNRHHRVTCLDEMRFAVDGTIEPVRMT
jgi:beta-xylosidase